MTTNGHQSDLAASSIDVEPTERQRAAYDLASALNRPGGPDWAIVDDTFKALTGVEDSGDFTLESAKRAAARIYEGLLSGQEPLPAQYEAVSLALEQSRKARPIEVTDGIPEHLLARLAHRRLACQRLRRNAHRRRRRWEVATCPAARVGTQWRWSVVGRRRTDAGTRCGLRDGL